MAVEVELQKALYLALTAEGLTVYDKAPQAADAGATTNWPYVEVGFISIVPFDTARELGHDAIARIHTRSRSASMMECKTLQGEIYDRLHRGALSVTGFSTITMQRETTRCDVMPDDSIHGVCEYRVLLETT